MKRESSVRSIINGGDDSPDGIDNEDIEEIKRPSEEKMHFINLKFVDDKELEDEFVLHTWTESIYFLKCITIIVAIVADISLSWGIIANFFDQFQFSLLSFLIRGRSEAGSQKGDGIYDGCAADACIDHGMIILNDNKNSYFSKQNPNDKVISSDADNSFIFLVAMQCNILTLYWFYDPYPHLNYRLFFLFQTNGTSVLLSLLYLFDKYFINCNNDNTSYQATPSTVSSYNLTSSSKFQAFMDQRTISVCEGRKYGVGVVEYHLADIWLILGQPLIGYPWSYMIYVRWIHVLLSTFALYDQENHDASLEVAFMHLITGTLVCILVVTLEQANRCQFLVERYLRKKRDRERKVFERKKQEAEYRATKVIAKLERSLKNAMRLCLPEIPFVSRSILNMLMQERDRITKEKGSVTTQFIEISQTSTKQFQYIDTIRYMTSSSPSFIVESNSLKEDHERLKKSSKDKLTVIEQRKEKDEMIREYGKIVIKKIKGSGSSLSSKSSASLSTKSSTSMEMDLTQPDCVAKYFNVEELCENDPVWSDKRCCTEFVTRLQQACEMQHKNLLKIIAYSFQPRLAIFHETPFLLENEVYSVRRLMEKNLHKVMRIELVVDILYQIACALEYLHTNDVCHGNLSLDTILITSIDQLEENDVPDASQNGEDGSEEDDSYSKILQATIKLDIIDCAYFCPTRYKNIAPEVHSWNYQTNKSDSYLRSVSTDESDGLSEKKSKAERQLEKEMDIFQFGVCLWQMLNDKLDPVAIGNMAALSFDNKNLNGNQSQPPASINSAVYVKKSLIPKDLEFLTLDCLSPEPEQRPTIYMIRFNLLNMREKFRPSDSLFS